MREGNDKGVYLYMLKDGRSKGRVQLHEKVPLYLEKNDSNLMNEKFIISMGWNNIQGKDKLEVKMWKWEELLTMGMTGEPMLEPPNTF